jgi:hypothetical protein
MLLRSFAGALLAALTLLTTPAFAGDSPAPCDSEVTQLIASIGKPQYAEAQKAADECHAREKKKDVTAATGAIWSTKIELLPSGGWEVLDVSEDGISILFGSRRHEVRKGTTVAIWLRDEFRENQVKNGQTYKGLVERDVYDCERMTNKTLSVTYYAENNLQASGNSYSYDEGTVRWIPIIPGTVGESILEWACKSSK